MTDTVKSSQSRVWTFDGGVGPFSLTVYQGCMKIGDPSQSMGDITPIKCPDPNRFGAFVTVSETQAAAENVAVPLNGRYPLALSSMLDMARRRCRVDVQAHIGACRNPQDYKSGWEKIIHFSNGHFTTYGAENLGALSDDENNPTLENVDLSARDWYEIVKLGLARVAVAEAAREIKTIEICDAASCAECGSASSGCQKVFATMVGVGATPGTKPITLYSKDGGLTWGTSTISTMFANETISGADCVGDSFVVISQTSVSLHFADIDDLLNGVATWSEVITGFVAAGAPNAMYCVDPRNTWFVGNAGYVYWTADITSGVSVQSAGGATVQNLNAVHAHDTANVLAVGNSNAVIYTQNGGDTWTAVVGPIPGVVLRTCWMWSPSTWIVGNVNGVFHKTNDYGATWVLITLPNQSAITSNPKIHFANDTVGYISVRQNSVAAVYRTTNGGATWAVLPEQGKAAPAVADYYNEMEACIYNPNIFFAGGMNDDGVTGYILKGSGE